MEMNFILCEVETGILCAPVMYVNFTQRPFSLEVRIRSQDSLYEILLGKVATGAGFSPSAPFLHVSVFRLYSRLIIFIRILSRRTNGRNVGTFKQK